MKTMKTNHSPKLTSNLETTNTTLPLQPLNATQQQPAKIDFSLTQPIRDKNNLHPENSSLEVAFKDACQKGNYQLYTKFRKQIIITPRIAQTTIYTAMKLDLIETPADTKKSVILMLQDAIKVIHHDEKYNFESYIALTYWRRKLISLHVLRKISL